MEHFIDIYKKKTKGPKYCEDLLNRSGIKINLKVDGKPFQVLYNKDTDEVEWHGRSGNETTVGPLVDDYTRLFSKAVNDAIKHLETRKDIIKEYKFLTFEVIDNMLLLTAIIDNDDNFINDAGEIKKIADKLDTDVMPTLWEGPLSAEQKDSILQIISTGVCPEKGDFINWVKQMFGTYKAFPKKLISAADDFIEGIVFFFDVDGSIIEYKLVDPTYRQSMKDRDAGHEAEREKYAEHYDFIYTHMVDWLEKNAKKLDDTQLKSMQLNFVEMSKEPFYKELIEHMKAMHLPRNERYGVQVERIIPELKDILNTDAAKSLFELYIKTFYKEKKRAFIISQEFQQKINKICQTMKGVSEEKISLRDYIYEHLYNL